MEGTVEAYCLGLLTDEETKAIELKAGHDAALRQSIDDFTTLLEQSLFKIAVNPGKEIRAFTFELLENLKKEEKKDFADLPVLNKYSDYKNWLQIVKHLLPPTLTGGVFANEFKNDGKVSLTLLWTNADYPDEVHEDVLESFLLLKGKCCCHVQGKALELQPGGFLEIPLHQHHDVKVLETVLAVVQRVKVA